MNDGNLPPPFVVGQKYCDREGEYTVIATDQDRITIERPDGRRTIADAALKARIHRNVIAGTRRRRREWACASQQEAG